MPAGGPEPRLASHVWVQAQVRLCDRHFLPVAVVKRGDAEAGAVIVRLLRGRDASLILRRHARADGASAWMVAGGGQPVDDAAAAAYLAREIARDRDLWVIEVEDPKGRYWPDRPIEDG